MLSRSRLRDWPLRHIVATLECWSEGWSHSEQSVVSIGGSSLCRGASLCDMWACRCAVALDSRRWKAIQACHEGTKVPPGRSQGSFVLRMASRRHIAGGHTPPRTLRYVVARLTWCVPHHVGCRGSHLIKCHTTHAGISARTYRSADQSGPCWLVCDGTASHLARTPI